MISILEILTGGGGVKNPKNSTDVICTWPLKQYLHHFHEISSNFSIRHQILKCSDHICHLCLHESALSIKSISFRIAWNLSILNFVYYF